MSEPPPLAPYWARLLIGAAALGSVQRLAGIGRTGTGGTAAVTLALSLALAATLEISRSRPRVRVVVAAGIALALPPLWPMTLGVPFTPQLVRSLVTGVGAMFVTLLLTLPVMLAGMWLARLGMPGGAEAMWGGAGAGLVAGLDVHATLIALQTTRWRRPW